MYRDVGIVWIIRMMYGCSKAEMLKAMSVEIKKNSCMQGC